MTDSHDTCEFVMTDDSGREFALLIDLRSGAFGFFASDESPDDSPTD